VVEADPILTEMSSILNEFELISKRKPSEQSKKQTLLGKDRRGRLTITFSSEKEVIDIKVDQRFKLSARNTLGIRTKDDWIFHLNIGNVM
jgi:hypothetical protein